MIEQKLELQLNEEDPFETSTVLVKVSRGTKVLSSEPYAVDLLKMYGVLDEAVNITKQQELGKATAGVGKIVSMSGNTALIDMGGKYTAYCQLDSEKREIRDQLVPGMQVELKHKRIGRGQVVASISDAVDDMREQEIIDAIGDKTVAFTGKVVELINGGYWIDISGVKCFMPGSLAGMNKLWDFEALVGKELVFMPINYSRERGVVVVSHREYLKTLVPNKILERRANLKERVTGFVTGTTKFGVFVEFDGCLTGMIPREELVESAAAYEARQIKPGDEISAWVKDIINDNKITLTQLGAVHNPWEGSDERYPPMSAHTGTVTKMTKYGAFVKLEEGIVGLVHVSGLKDISLEAGAHVNVRVRSISALEQRISLAVIS